ncbi:hypothetical protein KIN20_033821 [Parelaphostrongylus tenuis]|uniref:Uncharacterized protein n=1 Tax=Parelaphostrongylus tenuis TaxID=148309 RepID=A0AAD5R972_PARTN|nr:hypothetical protein KIN20_033821 [Parelaphostrongylus tenuis]
MELSEEEISPLIHSTTKRVSTFQRLIDKSARRIVTKFPKFVQFSVGWRHSVKKKAD